MPNADDLRELAMVPVRKTVYIVSRPFVLVWMAIAYILALLYSIVAKIVRLALCVLFQQAQLVHSCLLYSIPVNYVGRAARRVQLTWNWTKSSARSMLPWGRASPDRGTFIFVYSSGLWRLECTMNIVQFIV